MQCPPTDRSSNQPVHSLSGLGAGARAQRGIWHFLHVPTCRELGADRQSRAKGRFLRLGQSRSVGTPSPSSPFSSLQQLPAPIPVPFVLGAIQGQHTSSKVGDWTKLDQPPVAPPLTLHLTCPHKARGLHDERRKKHDCPARAGQVPEQGCRRDGAAVLMQPSLKSFAHPAFSFVRVHPHLFSFRQFGFFDPMTASRRSGLCSPRSQPRRECLERELQGNQGDGRGRGRGSQMINLTRSSQNWPHIPLTHVPARPPFSSVCH
jgi:hypothetical protein